MILECPECSAKFTVPANALGSAGRQVRCGKCKHMWHAMPAGAAAPAFAPDMDEDAKPATPPSPDFDALMAGIKPKAERTEDSVYGGFGSPAATGRKRMQKFFYAAAYTAVAAAIALLILIQHKAEWFGYVPSQGFAFEAVRAKPMAQVEGGRFANTPLYSIEGVIRNSSTESKSRPMIRVALVNNTGGEVYARLYPSPDSDIQPGSAVEFKIERLERPDASAHFTIEMGNSLELALRDVSHAPY